MITVAWPGSVPVVYSRLERLGFEYIGREGAHLPQLNAVKVPANVDEARLRSILLNEYSIEIGAGLGALAGKIVRIGLMGQSCSTRNVALCLPALDAALPAARSQTPSAARVIRGKSVA